MLITLIRHAQIDSIYQGTYIGHLDAPLSNEGIQSAKELGKKLNAQHFDVVFSSDLQRAKETLRYCKHSKKALYTPLLREKSWGRHEGMRFEEIVALEKVEYQNFKQWLDILDGEDYSHYINRVKMFFLHFLKALHVENVLVVTHAGVIRILLMLVKEISLEEAFSIKIEYAQSLTLNLKTMEVTL